MIRYEEEWYEPPDDERQPKPWVRKQKKRERRKWRPLRVERPRVVKGFGR